MSDKLRRFTAIVALVLIGVFTVSFVLYLFNKEMLNGAIGDLALWSGGFGLLFTLVLYIVRAFPSQQVKDEERERLYKEAEEANASETNETKTGDDNTISDVNAESEDEKEDVTDR